MIMVLTPVGQIYAATQATVEIVKNNPTVTLADSGERIFQIGYGFDVDFDVHATGLDLVLVLDRSNSMLRTDPSTDLPVADAVWHAVNEFITEYYNTYPDSNVAVVSFGANGNKSDNWKYFNSLEDTLDEISEVYEYRNLYNNYHQNFRSYWNNGYRFAWENWQISDGATNIAAAFEYASTTVDHKQVVDEENGQDVILLFTDGVATQGGSKSQKNYNYPTAHNTNTIAAYEAGIEAQEVAEVITVGYFEGIENNYTKAVARETLELSQNAGLFEASQTGQLANIFETVVEELNYAGTDAVVTEVIEDEFEVVLDSIHPAASSVSLDDQGRTVIIWDLGNVVDTTYSLGYKVKVKSDVYPTGSGTLEIPINLDAQLTYTDLDGQVVTEYLGQNKTVIPPRSNQPVVNVAVVYEDGYGYLVGDVMTLDHQMSFINEIPFDYTSILVRDLRKTISGGSFGSQIDIYSDSRDDGWVGISDQLVLDLQRTKTTNGLENLVWSEAKDLSVVVNEVGSYNLGYRVDYQLTNEVGTTFDFVEAQNDPSTVYVREGILRLNLLDNFGGAITTATIFIDDVVTNYTLEGDQIVLRGVTSGTHTIAFQVPSGYEFTSGDLGVVQTEDDITFTEAFDYNHSEVTKTIHFNRLNIREIAITDREGNDQVDLDTVEESVEALVNFTLTVPLTKVAMRIVDDYDLADHEFVLETVAGLGHVEDSAGNQVNGFSMIDGFLSYDGPQLASDSFRAFGTVLAPSGFGDDYDYDYEVYVDQIITREELGDSVDVSAMTSEVLYLELGDNDAPLIEPVINDENTTTNIANYDVSIRDKVQIVEIIVYEGLLSLEGIQSDSVTNEFEVIDPSEITEMSLWNYNSYINTDVELNVEVVDNKWLSKGNITIYARDAFGNEGVEVIEIDYEDVNDLLENNLK